MGKKMTIREAAKELGITYQGVKHLITEHNIKTDRRKVKQHITKHQTLVVVDIDKLKKARER